MARHATHTSTFQNSGSWAKKLLICLHVDARNPCLSVVRQDVRLSPVLKLPPYVPLLSSTPYLYYRHIYNYGAMGELAVDFGIINADNVEQVRLQRFNLIISFPFFNFILTLRLSSRY